MTDPSNQTKKPKQTKQTAPRPRGCERTCDPSVWLKAGPKKAPHLTKGQRRAKRLASAAKRAAQPAKKKKKQKRLEIAGITAVRYKNGVTEFRVRWEGYAIGAASWEPIDHLGDHGEYLAEEYLGHPLETVQL